LISISEFYQLVPKFLKLTAEFFELHGSGSPLKLNRLEDESIHFRASTIDFDVPKIDCNGTNIKF